MRVISRLPKAKLRGAIVALGTFDGVHRGHQQLLKTAILHARKQKLAALAVTFDPHPQQLILPERGLSLLTTIKERAELFEKIGLDGVVVIKFNPRIQTLDYKDFVKKYLVKKLGIKHVLVGYDFAFGKKRRGDVHNLKMLGKKYGFEVEVIQAVARRHTVIKSSRIREMISRGQFREAIGLLGHPYQLTGKVIKGEGRGRGLGFPTANLGVDRHKLIPAFGVYAGFVCISAKKYRCCINIGARPTFGVGKVALEVHIIGFNGNLVGKTIKAALQYRLRDEIHFSDVENLKRQIKQDIISACRKVRL